MRAVQSRRRAVRSWSRRTGLLPGDARFGETLKAIIDEVAQPIFVKDRSHRWVFVNPAFCQMLGKGADELVGKSDLDFFPKEQVEVFWERDDQVFATGRGDDNEEKFTDSEGRVRTILTRKRLFISSDGTPALVGIITDITEFREAEARISHLAKHDPLTGLPNRSVLQTRLGQELQACKAGNQHLAVMFLDLDRFKEINDTLGHAAGDMLLRIVSERLLGCLRNSDVVARLGGDEFAILAKVSGSAETAAFARKLHAVVSAPIEMACHTATTGVSIGIAIAPGDGEDAEQLLKNADLALYSAKASGRNAFSFFEPELNRRLLARRQLEADLRRALIENQLEVYFQPIVNLERNEISGCEALLRWNHPQRGLVSPAEFIPLAEETGLIVPIGEWVLRQATAEASGWPEHVSISVNLSVAQFKNPDLAASVVRALASSGLKAQRLELEITESILIEDSIAAQTILSRLHGLGVKISLDDFGSGYSSLGYLRSFPFDKLKIDRSFINALVEDRHSAVLLQAIASLGLGLGIPTVAEGVETPEQLTKVRAEGCTEMQGYLFSPPRNVTDIRKLLLSSARP